MADLNGNGYRVLPGDEPAKPANKLERSPLARSQLKGALDLPIAPGRKPRQAASQPKEPALKPAIMSRQPSEPHLQRAPTDVKDSPRIIGFSPRDNSPKIPGSKFRSKAHKSTLSVISTDILRAYADYSSKRATTWVILPNSTFLVRWDVLMLGSLLVVGIMQPVVAAFGLYGRRMLVVELLSSLIFFMDTGLMFLRAINESTRDGRVLITDTRELARRYLRGAFALDFVSSMPFSVIFGSCKWSLMSMVRFARLPRLLLHIQSATGISFSILNLTEFCLMSCLVLHWIACSWVAFGLYAHHSWLTAAQDKLPFFETASRADVYLLSFYWSVTVLSSVGFGDITPVSRGEFICSIVCMGIGGGVWAYIVGSVCSMTSAMDKHRITFEEKMNEVDTICNERKLPMDLQERVRSFFQNAKEFLRIQEYHATINELSPALKGEVVMWMYGTCFRKVWYFDVVDKPMALVLLEGMRPFMYAPQELVMNMVDGVRAILFLRSGLCVRKKVFLAPGAVWGTDVILDNLEHEDTEDLMDPHLARTANYVFVLKLSKAGIDHCCAVFPAFGQRIRKAHIRMLCWRSVIAASRAAQNYDANKGQPLTRWESLGFSLASKLHEQHEEISSLAPMHHVKSSGSLTPSAGSSPSFAGANDTSRQPERQRLLTPMCEPNSVPPSVPPSVTDMGPVRSEGDGGTRRTSEVGTDEYVGVLEELRLFKEETKAEMSSLRQDVNHLSSMMEKVLMLLQKQEVQQPEDHGHVTRQFSFE